MEKMIALVMGKVWMKVILMLPVRVKGRREQMAT